MANDIKGNFIIAKFQTYPSPEPTGYAVGFSVNTLLTLGILSFSVGAISWAFPQHTVTILEQMQEAIHHAATKN